MAHVQSGDIADNALEGNRLLPLYRLVNHCVVVLQKGLEGKPLSDQWIIHVLKAQLLADDIALNRPVVFVQLRLGNKFLAFPGGNWVGDVHNSLLQAGVSGQSIDPRLGVRVVAPVPLGNDLVHGGGRAHPHILAQLVGDHVEHNGALGHLLGLLKEGAVEAPPEGALLPGVGIWVAVVVNHGIIGYVNKHVNFLRSC